MLSDQTVGFLKVPGGGAVSQPKRADKHRRYSMILASKIIIPESKSKRKRNGPLGAMNTVEPTGNTKTGLKYNSNQVLKQDEEADYQDYYVHPS